MGSGGVLVWTHTLGEGGRGFLTVIFILGRAGSYERLF